MDLRKTRPQLVILILETLDQLGCSGSREEVLHRIANEGWFARIDLEDNVPYASVSDGGSQEPRWRTLLSWARKDAFDGAYPGLLDGGERGTWTLTRRGRETLNQIKTDFQTGRSQSKICYMWSVAFKAMLDPNYRPGEDRSRPHGIYEKTEHFVSAQVSMALRILSRMPDEPKDEDKRT